MSSSAAVTTKNIFLGTGVALVLDIILFAIANGAGATWNVGQPTNINIGMVAAASIIPMISGGFITKAIANKKPGFIKFAAWAVLVFSIAGAPGGWISSQDLATGLALGAMHVVVGLSWFFIVLAKKN